MKTGTGQRWGFGLLLAGLIVGSINLGGPVGLAQGHREGVQGGTPLFRFGGRIVKGAPFIARAETGFVQTLADGTRLTRQTQALIARDDVGRTRREQTLAGLGALTADGGAGALTTFVFIHDPVLNLEYIVDVARRSYLRKSFIHRPAPPRSERPREVNERRESLGRRLIEGVEAEGTRAIITIPPGQIGNDRAVEIVSEQWYAPSLQEIVLSLHRDPRFGETTYQLRQIELRPPDPALFQPPADFAVTTGRPVGRGDRHRR